MDIGSKIQKIRQEKNLTQEQLAGKLHVTRNAVSKWETGKGLPNLESLRDLSRLFQISLDALFSDEDLVVLNREAEEKRDGRKSLICSGGLFLTYTLIGTLVPYFILSSDPTAGMAVFAIILPLSYAILGVLCLLLSLRWPYVVLSSALAMTPIHLVFDFAFPSVGLGFWESLIS